ncbi:AAA domain protein [Bifidobacterium saguini DSM 23967]|uniref:AAA domain protein n=4 Tax=Bifidobacterium saguini TaxID=762210 RepID=A0A087D812_9BIFI|nr:ATP-binding protein [Bifidobacterium saguini]KFI91662.1 AAA domain protein [Bifidobacterium saguini DSM 23967]QTB91887.1 ATP-binding protein [Bifidobacterium saguini]
MIPRMLGKQAQQLAQWFPVVSITGPRQSGKSTMAKAIFPDYDYVNLENPQTRKAAIDDPVGFIRQRPSKLIVDEAQYAPDLFSMIQVVSDERGEQGQYVLSGSQNFLLLKRIQQSLAGRVGLVKLLPLSYQEACDANPSLTADSFMLQGGYPRIYDTGMPLNLFFSNYIDTYIERDVSEYLDVRNLADFRRFLTLCALSSGALVNYTNIANELGVSPRTVKAWTSILESSYLAFHLMPFYTNARKQVVKTPKLYFYDTGLLCYLLGIHTVEALIAHPKFGDIFENLIIAETMKWHLNAGRDPQLFFYRDASKVEVDLLDFTDPNNRLMIEIKSGQTYHDRFARHLTLIGDVLGIPKAQQYVVGRVEQSYTSQGIHVTTATDWLNGKR